MATAKALPPVAVLRRLLAYDPETGVLTWKARPASDFKTKKADDWNAKHVGLPAGRVNVMPWGYECIQLYLSWGAGIKGRYAKAHRVVWKIVTGLEPPAVVDHRDGDGTNNRWANLRDGTAINRKNLPKSKHNKSGLTGICWLESRQEWRVTVGRKEIGRFAKDEIDIALMELMEHRIEAGYSSRHGLEFAPYHQDNYA